MLDGRRLSGIVPLCIGHFYQLGITTTQMTKLFERELCVRGQHTASCVSELNTVSLYDVDRSAGSSEFQIISALGWRGFPLYQEHVH